jgi:hypothetical protein
LVVALNLVALSGYASCILCPTTMVSSSMALGDSFHLLFSESILLLHCFSQQVEVFFVDEVLGVFFGSTDLPP